MWKIISLACHNSYWGWLRTYNFFQRSQSIDVETPFVDFSDALHKSKRRIPRHLHIQYHGWQPHRPRNTLWMTARSWCFWGVADLPKWLQGWAGWVSPQKNGLRFWSTRFVYKVARCCKCVLLVERVGVLFTPIAFLSGWWTCFLGWGKTQSLLSREHLDVISSVWKYRIMSIPDSSWGLLFDKLNIPNWTSIVDHEIVQQNTSRDPLLFLYSHVHLTHTHRHTHL